MEGSCHTLLPLLCMTDDASLPALLSSDSGALDGQRLSDAVFDVFCTAADEYGIEYEFDFADGVFFAGVSGPPSDRDLSPRIREGWSAGPADSDVARCGGAVIFE